MKMSFGSLCPRSGISEIRKPAGGLAEEESSLMRDMAWNQAGGTWAESGGDVLSSCPHHTATSLQYTVEKMAMLLFLNYFNMFTPCRR